MSINFSQVEKIIIPNNQEVYKITNSNNEIIWEKNLYDYTIYPNDRDCQYGFKLNSAGYYESENKGIGNSWSKATINFKFLESKKITIVVINYAEPGYDFGVIGTNIERSTNTANDTLFWDGKYSSKHSPNPVSIEYTVPAGDHWIGFKYVKDRSVNKNNDSFQWKIII